MGISEDHGYGTAGALSPADESALRGLLADLGDAWARGDGGAYAALFTDDARYTAAPGQRTVGRRAIAEGHQKIFDSFFRNTRLGSARPTEFQPVAPDVVLMHSSGAVLFPGEDERAVSPNGLLTFVAVRRADGWRIASFNNTPTGRARDARFLWRYLRSRVTVVRAEPRKAKAHMMAEKRRNLGPR